MHGHTDIDRSSLGCVLGPLLDNSRIVDAFNLERLRRAHIQNILVLHQAGVLVCPSDLRNTELHLLLLSFEPAVVVEDELLHSFEKLERATVYRLHLNEELADLRLKLSVSFFELLLHLDLHLGLSDLALRLLLAALGRKVAQSIEMVHLRFELVEALVVISEHLTILIN